MKLTIFAATGGIGRQIFEQAVAAGHEVTAVARDPRSLAGEARLVAADLTAADPAVLASAVAKSDAVLSGLGPRKPRTEAGITSRGTKAILTAMRTAGVRRLVVVSAAPVGTVPSPGRPNPPKHDPGDGFFMRHLGSRFAHAMLGAHFADLAVMEDLVRESGLDWTISRPPQLTDGPLTGDYRTAYGRNIRGGTRVSRANVAHHMLAVIDQPSTINKIIGIADQRGGAR
ncbi:NAD(P)-dependent oxidoreductase [Actinoallomurus iriomotensis]|uniref:NAD(P)-binding domain-containing protein n=1 Tax=Actinoallomurus iriomotensis TaxID=478107 RepID=A0A9W6VPF4_9ACTN|nr:NAD(P)-binding oxidoreductase [Actinoallomurus iriomotensis]GLY79868.1 hypothetical protein Airi01_081350 [Actinoallomurus iriomotensis]